MSVPELRFPEFEGEWGEKKLGDIGTFKNGVNKDKSDFGQGVPFINLMDVFGKNSISESKFDLVNATPKELKESNLLKGDVLFIRSSVKPSGVGLTAVINENLENTVYSGFLIRFREKEKIFDHNFKKYCFYTNKFRNSLMRKSSTSANTNINQESLNKLEIQIPSLSEQEKIASFLSAVDEKIEKLEKKLELWEAYKKGMMQKIFSQELRFKDGNGEEYPEWEERKLCEISIINPKANILPDEFVYIDLESVDSGILKKIKKTMKKDAPSRAKRVLENNDILYQTVRPYQKNNLFFQTNNLDNYVASTGYAQIRAEKDSKFLYHLIHTKNFVNDVLARCTGTSYPAINSKDLGKIKIFIPSSSEQKKIASFLSRLDEKIEMLGIKLEFWENYKKGLLQKMFC